MQASGSLQVPLIGLEKASAAGRDARRETCRWSTIAKASKSRTRQIQASEATNEPKHHDNDQEQTKNAPKPGTSVAVMSVVPSAAKKKNQDKDDKNRAHDSSSRQFLIAPVDPGTSITSFGRRALLRSDRRRRFESLPTALSIFPSFCSLASPTDLPFASLAAPFTSLIEPATLFLSIGAGSPCVSRGRLTALGSKPFGSGVGTLGQRFERRQPRKLLTPGPARRRCRIEKSDRMSARRRRVRRSRPCSCQARSRLSKEHQAWLGGSRDSGTRARQSRTVRAPTWNGHGIGGAAFASECKAASAWLSAATVANSPIGFLVAEHAGVLIVKVDLTGIGPVSQAFPFGSEQPRSAPLKVAALRTAQTIAAERTDRSRTDLPLCMPLSACVADSSRLQRRA
jgi:hypothetical protein